MISGLIILDKQTGPTSFDCVEQVKKIFRVDKAGHTGTLDPKVTGVLLILLGEARKLAPLFDKLNKTYLGVMHLHKEVEKEKLEEVLKKFRGEIIQIPPVRSRVKRVARKRTIYKLEIKKIEGRDITMFIECEHGTYIRKLFYDIGEELGCGAHMKYLRRTAVDGFKEEESVDLERLKKEREKCLIRNEEIISKLKISKISLKKEEEKKVENGVPIILKKTDKFIQGEKIAIFVENTLRAIGIVEKNKIKIDRVLKID